MNNQPYKPSNKEIDSVPDLEPVDLVKNTISRFKGPEQLSVILDLIDSGLGKHVASCIDFIDKENREKVTDRLLEFF